jgi:hypothetical protein
MSLTSYQAAPPRVFTYVDEAGESKLKKRLSARMILEIERLAPAVGFGGSLPSCHLLAGRRTFMRSSLTPVFVRKSLSEGVMPRVTFR